MCQAQTALVVLQTVHFLEKIEMIELESTGRRRKEERARDSLDTNAAKISQRKDSDSKEDL